MLATSMTSNFVNINTIEHRFPEELKGLNIQITLLHNHSHCPPNHVLVYQNKFTQSKYISREKAVITYFPCSWHLKDGNIQAYQFSDESFEYDEAQIEVHLKFLWKSGYKNYGTTTRPIQNMNELETQNGHVYVSKGQTESSENGRYSETALGITKIDGCYSRSYCYVGWNNVHTSHNEHIRS